ncbi:hypothetical protein chiPu_0022120, partial [Chiloscyllium punctatum]|nr:hypothetical protein [Chiloscyllium punctatum]
GEQKRVVNLQADVRERDWDGISGHCSGNSIELGPNAIAQGHSGYEKMSRY